MNIVYNGTRLLLVFIVLLLVKLFGGGLSWWVVVLPILSPVLVSVYLILFADIRRGR